MSTSDQHARAASAAMMGAAAGFVVVFAFAAHAYPGGTHFDHASGGHDFWRNTLCDVARTVAINGASNAPGCTLARVAMTLLALGLGVLFLTLPRLFPSHARLGAAVRGLGIATVPLAVTVVLLPADRFGQLHGAAVIAGGGVGIGAVLLALKGLFADARAPAIVVALGVLTMSVATVDLALYVIEHVSGGAAQVAVPILERASTILLLLWMVSVARAVRGPRVRTRARKTVQASTHPPRILP